MNIIGQTFRIDMLFQAMWRWIFCLLLISCQTAHKPIVIGHRGASGYRPEHTLASYELAIELGADYIEPDVVATKDGVLIARHENEISSTTDVALKFPERKKKKRIDDAEIEGWFTEDFTFVEIKNLKAKERLDFRSQDYNGMYEIPSLSEVIELVKRKSKEKGRSIGVYIETKHPTYFSSIGLPLEERVVGVLEKHDLNSKDALVFIQSFELTALRKFKSLTNIPLIFLYGEATARPYDFSLIGDPRTYGDLTKPTALREIREYVQGIGPSKHLVISEATGEPTSLVKDAHASGLLVHPYTFRNEARYLADVFHGQPQLEYEHFFKLGVDGVFSDFPDTALKARDSFFRKR